MSDEREYVTDIFGERCEVIARCQCGAPKYRRAGETGTTLMHAKGCLGLNLGAWHQDARAAQDEAGVRDIAQIESRVKNYGANVERPKDYVGPKRAPTPLGKYRSL